MTMRESDKLAIAAHLHVALRRHVGRVTDVEWMIRSPEYAREVIRVARAGPAHPDLIERAARLEAALFPAVPAVSAGRVPPAGPAVPPAPLAEAPLQRYIGRLR